MKYISLYVLLSVMTTMVRAQTMQWVPFEAKMAAGACAYESTKDQVICYALQYTPAVSGVLTSYTTGFYVSCTSLGSPVAKNQSCSMYNNVNLQNGCSTNGIVLMNSSGNTGNVVNNQLQAGIPVILHKVCFTIPKGESVTITEDQVTDLTTSIDVGGGTFTTEFPAFTESVISNTRYDDAKPTVFLDFQSTAAGDMISQLDWSATPVINSAYFIVERSLDDQAYEQLGRVEARHSAGSFHIYQFMDRNAVEGNNYYRLQQVSEDGKVEYSPVRMVNFKDVPFTVTFTPNPADDFLNVSIAGQKSSYEVRLVDYTGQVSLLEKPDQQTGQVRLAIDKLVPGVYSLVVESGQDKYIEKVVITH
jgi:hypothetical protein